MLNLFKTHKSLKIGEFLKIQKMSNQKEANYLIAISNLQSELDLAEETVSKYVNEIEKKYKNEITELQSKVKQLEDTIQKYKNG
jgi:phage host-nuclease inhibitor protein Gam